MQTEIIVYMFLFIFFVTAIVTILAISNIYPFNAMEDLYKKGLFSALLLELIAIVLAAGKVAFFGPNPVERYVWHIDYPSNLGKQFEDFYVKDKLFADFYEVNKNKGLQEITQDKRTKFELDKLLDSLFVVKKAYDFAGKTAEGEMFLIRENQKKGTNFGKAILTFPGETQPIAFGVTGQPEAGSSWPIVFHQPDRFVYHEGRINTWRGANMGVNFKAKEGLSTWSGEFHLPDINIKVGDFFLSKK